MTKENELKFWQTVLEHLGSYVNARRANVGHTIYISGENLSDAVGDKLRDLFLRVETEGSFYKVRNEIKQKCKDLHREIVGSSPNEVAEARKRLIDFMSQDVKKIITGRELAEKQRKAKLSKKPDKKKPAKNRK